MVVIAAVFFRFSLFTGVSILMFRMTVASLLLGGVQPALLGVMASSKANVGN